MIATTGIGPGPAVADPAPPRHLPVTARRPGRNQPYIPSPGMSLPSPRGNPSRGHDVRRVRDLVRAAVLADVYPEGQLPSEPELMSAYGVPRATVRDALALLRAEHLIERVQGVGTHAVVSATRAPMEEAHGVLGPRGSRLLDTQTRPRVLDRSVVPVPDSLSGWLGVQAGTPCLRLEYVAMADDKPMAIATNYVLFPEAGRLADAPFRSHWYGLLADAGVEMGESEFVIDCAQADPVSAELLGLEPGRPLLSIDQTITDIAGRVFDVAFIRMRTDRFRFVSRASAVSPVLL